ncbi:hypothetical protein [Photobacterium lutimaris]|uniref:hypothetical protein n=1 Tax=Photobacterium lutimaris TaxID=388278 RepID=UPI0010F2EA0A|nr:hypothetical protein [Photobacterium lutimaris]TDR72626.1 hypothetical protein DFP78_113102 [Photobacterium lutimaris]
MFTKKAIGLAVVTGVIGLLTGINIPTSPQEAYGDYLKQGVKATTAMVSKNSANVG